MQNCLLKSNTKNVTAGRKKVVVIVFSGCKKNLYNILFSFLFNSFYNTSWKRLVTRKPYNKERERLCVVERERYERERVCVCVCVGLNE